MAGNRISLGLAYLFRTARARTAEGQTDVHLLKHFLARRDEAAFAALVERHGPMVLGVCQRILGNAADVEDAFQATFLVLVRRASSLTSRAVLGDWLHGVARRTALNARRTVARHRAREQAMARPEVQGEEVRDDWRPLLDEALGRLPEKYRLAIVLCDLESKTRREAAEQLGWPEGTVAGRLARGRALLARQLARQGLTLTAAALATVIAQPASASVPVGLAASTAKAASLLVAGPAAAGVISTRVVELTEGVVQAMFLSKLKTTLATVVLVVLGVAALGYGVLPGGQSSRPVEGAKQPVAGAEAQPRPAPALVHRPASPFQFGVSLGATNFSRDGSQTTSVAFSPNGRRLVFVDWQIVKGVGYVFTLHFRKVATGKDLWQAQGRFAGMAFAPDGRTLATCEGAQVQLWEAATGKKLRSFTVAGKDLFLPHISSLAFAPDGKKLAVVSINHMQFSPGDIDDSKTIALFYLWDVTTGKELRQGRSQNGIYYRLVGFAADGKLLAWEATSQSLYRLLDLNTGKALFVFGQPPNPVPFAVFSPDGRTCVWGSTEYNVWDIHQWDLVGDKEIRRLKGPAGSVTALAFSPDGKLLASAGAYTVTLWNAATGKELRLLRGHEHTVTTLAFAPDGKTLASGDLDGRVYLWEVTTGKVRDQFRRQKGWITSVCFSPDGKMLVGSENSVNQSGQAVDEAFLWDLTVPKPRERTPAPNP